MRAVFSTFQCLFSRAWACQIHAFSGILLLTFLSDICRSKCCLTFFKFLYWTSVICTTFYMYNASAFSCAHWFSLFSVFVDVLFQSCAVSCFWACVKYLIVVWIKFKTVQSQSEISSSFTIPFQLLIAVSPDVGLTRHWTDWNASSL